MKMDKDAQEVVELEPVAQEPIRSGRIRHKHERYKFLIIDDQSIMLVDQDEPTSYCEPIESPNSAKL